MPGEASGSSLGSGADLGFRFSAHNVLILPQDHLPPQMPQHLVNLWCWVNGLA